MNTRLIQPLERILLTLWAGSLWVSYIGLVCGSSLLLLNAAIHKCINWRVLVIIGMLLLIVIGQFVITPMVVELRVQGLTDTPRFGQLHGVASVLFLMTSVLALALVAAGKKHTS
jgi:hypothetical protein